LGLYREQGNEAAAEAFRQRFFDRMWDLSAYMKDLKQCFSQWFNRKHGRRGVLWEGRFDSELVEDGHAARRVSAYIDLNPVRAGMADTPEASSHTSLRERLQPEFDVQQAIDDQTGCGDLLDFRTPLKPLLPFENRLLNEPQTGILFNFEQYLALVDWTGRTIRGDKRGHIDSALPPILNRLQITADQWRINTTQFEAIHPKRFNRLIPQLDTG
jgi:hypothetical protein